MMTGPRVFLSYSHSDKVWKERLVRHLQVIVQEGHLDVWDDGLLQAGDAWKEQLVQALNAAHVGLLLVSAEFLTSGFVTQEEVPRLLQRRSRDGIRIFPVIARPCAWQEVGWLAEMQVRPLGAKALSSLPGEDTQDQAMTDIAREVLTLGRKVFQAQVESAAADRPDAAEGNGTANPRAQLFPRLATPEHLKRR